MGHNNPSSIVTGGHGDRLITQASFEEAGVSGELFAITEEPVDVGRLTEQLAADAADRSVTKSEDAVIGMYPQEQWLGIDAPGGRLQLPFSPIERYLEGDMSRAAEMEVTVLPPYEVHPAFREFRDRLVEQQIAQGRNLSNGTMLSVARFDHDANVMHVRPVGYFDIFAMQSYGPDVPFGSDMQVEGMSGGTLREMLGDGRLPVIGEDSLVPNSFGVGGILETGDGKLLLCRRRGGLGIASASGTFGYAAAGNLGWTDDLRAAFDTMPAVEALAQHGIGAETQEELGMRTHFRDPRKMFDHAMRRLLMSELGLPPEDCSATHTSIDRDGLHMGMPQSTYLLKTALPAEEVVRRMVGSPDAKKEYDLVLAVNNDPDSIRTILANGLVSFGINVNAETRSSLASILTQTGGAELLA
jgi:hypothetical protein